MKNDFLILTIKEKYNSLENFLDEKSKRVWAATEARSYGWGGISAVCIATGIDHKTIRKGLLDLKSEKILKEGSIRKKGSGRRKISDEKPDILEAIEKLIDLTTRGDPESPLRWTCKSSYQIAKALKQQGYAISQKSVYTLLTRELDYSLQSNKKTKEGNCHSDRDAQFQYINKKIKQFQGKNYPSLSIDKKRKEKRENW